MFQSAVMDKVDRVKSVGADDVLAAFGLARRRGALEMLMPATALFGVGMLIGAGVALLVAPKSGRETRSGIKEKAQALTHRLSSTAEHLVEGAKTALPGHEEARRAPNRPDRRPNEASPPPHPAL